MKIETERLILRLHRPEDLPASAAMWADPVVVRHIGGRPFTAEEVWSRLLRYAGLWAILGFGYWAVEDKAGGDFAGEVGFADFRRDLTPSFDGAPELGWVLASRFHGKGYATEAVKAAVTWGETHLKSRRTVCIIDPGNTASIRVATKCGFKENGLSIYKGEPVSVYQRCLVTA